MKTITTIFALAILCIATSVQATVRTVSNSYNSPGQYTTINTAIAASTAGDTIYISGSPFGYGSFQVSQSLVLIGPGHNPAKQNPLAASLATVTVTASNVKIIGFTIATVTINGTISGFTLQRCKVSDKVTTASSSGNTTGVNISGCVFTSLTDNIVGNSGNIYNYNWIIANNIISGKIPAINSTNGTNSYLINNVFIHSTKNFSTFNTSVFYCVINNNIFWATEPGGVNYNSFTIFNNNISYSCTTGTFPPPGINNLVNTLPQFEGYSTDANFSYSQNFHIVDGSAGDNSGTDFTDRGIYGGNTNIFSMTGEPAIPEITAFTLSSSTVAPGDSINVNVTTTRIK